MGTPRSRMVCALNGEIRSCMHELDMLQAEVSSHTSVQLSHARQKNEVPKESSDLVQAARKYTPREYILELITALNRRRSAYVNMIDVDPMADSVITSLWEIYDMNDLANLNERNCLIAGLYSRKDTDLIATGIDTIDKHVLVESEQYDELHESILQIRQALDDLSNAIRPYEP